MYSKAIDQEVKALGTRDLVLTATLMVRRSMACAVHNGGKVMKQSICTVQEVEGRWGEERSMDDRAGGWIQARLIEALDPSDPDRRRDDVVICHLCPFRVDNPGSRPPHESTIAIPKVQPDFQQKLQWLKL